MTYWSTRLWRFIDQENEIIRNRNFVQDIKFLLYFEKLKPCIGFFQFRLDPLNYHFKMPICRRKERCNPQKKSLENAKKKTRCS